MPRASKLGTSSLSFFLPIISIQQRPIPYIVVSTYKLYRFEGASKSDSGMYYYRYGANYRGDSDTLACITGSIAEAYFGVPDELYTAAFSRLTPHFKNVITEFEEKFGSHILK